MNSQSDQISQSSNINMELMEQVQLDPIEISAEDSEQQNLNDDELETIVGGASAGLGGEITEHSSSGSFGSVASHLDSVAGSLHSHGSEEAASTSPKGWGKSALGEVGATLTGGATSLSVGFVGQVIINKVSNK